MSSLPIVGSDLRLALVVLRNGVKPGLTNPMTSAKIVYIDPTAVEGNWTGVIDSGSDGTVHYDLTKEANTKSGIYKVWAEVTYTDGSFLVTDAQAVTIYPKGTVDLKARLN